MRAWGLEPPDEIVADGEVRRFATNGKRGDDAGWYVLHANGIPAGAFGDWRTGASETWRANVGRKLSPQEAAGHRRRVDAARAKAEAEREAQQAKAARRIAELWAQTVPVSEGDPVSRYLRRRALAGPVPVALRLHPRLTYWDGGERSSYPAMVAPLVSPGGRVLALHRTYLTADGCKAPVPIVRKLTGAAGPLAGACIPLHEAREGVIGIAEGIETAQAVHLASGLPTVAAYCAGSLAAYVWPAGLRRLVVFADADPAGAAAAQSLRARAVRAGLRVAVLAPGTPGADWCDVWAQRGAVAASEVVA